MAEPELATNELFKTFNVPEEQWRTRDDITTWKKAPLDARETSWDDLYMMAHHRNNWGNLANNRAAFNRLQAAAKTRRDMLHLANINDFDSVPDKSVPFVDPFITSQYRQYK